ncbi:MAG: hypothetical protein QG591_2376 [Planctomycetota bacterium]|nr:hypothetical protein [Planctomycetota bacterium]
MEESNRPWGYYKVLDDTVNHKVKKIVVFPGCRLSLQRHKHRSEHWYIIQGKAIVKKDSDELHFNSGTNVDIPRGCWHRIENFYGEHLILIEIQQGDYCGEDDIERLEDDYGRTLSPG